MEFIVIFSISGIMVTLLPISKAAGKRRGEELFILRLISKGDAYVRELHHQVAHLYCQSKEKGSFFWKKQIPIHSKNIFNKLLTFLRQKREQYANNMRDSRLLKKPDGLSAFFKNMSDIEKGNGEINEELMNQEAGSENQE